MGEVTLRVHGGEARGRRLTTPPGIRPTKGMVVEAIFNLLGERVLDAEVVDLCAGSGALGIEALSRGAEQAIFVERNPTTAVVIDQNLERLGYAKRGQVIQSEACRWLAGDGGSSEAARLWLVDPPYNQPVLAGILGRLDELVGAGIVVVEHAAEQLLPALTHLQVIKQRRYGDSRVTVLEK
ncbi:MAG: 16S rRNA (guanine(966)-N(2))-methyltransferase RsmD [Candidatus Dormibacteraceae bacterium]